MTMTNRQFFADIPADLKDEFIETILHACNFRIERIVSKGHRSEEGFWYDQSENEWVILLKGGAALCFENQSRAINMNPGDYIHIPKHVRHRVEWTNPDEETIWLAVYYS